MSISSTTPIEQVLPCASALRRLAGAIATCHATGSTASAATMRSPVSRFLADFPWYGREEQRTRAPQEPVTLDASVADYFARFAWEGSPGGSTAMPSAGNPDQPRQGNAANLARLLDDIFE